MLTVPSVWATVHVDCTINLSYCACLLHYQSELLCMLTAPSFWVTVHVDCTISLSYCACWLHHQSELLCTLTAPLIWATVHVDCTISLSYCACWLHYQSELLCMLTALSVWATVHVDYTIILSYCACWLHYQSELLCTLTAQLFSSTVHFNCIISSYYRWLLALWRAIHQHKFEKDDECCGFVELRIKWLTIHLHFNHSDIQLLSSECHLLYLSCALFIAIGTLRQLALPIFMGVKKLQQETTKKHHPINL